MLESCTGMLAPAYAERFPLIQGLAPHGSGARTAEEIRRLAAFDAPMGEVRLPACVVADQVIPGPHGPIPVRIYARPAQEKPMPALLWLHGGAFMFGDLDMPEADHTARYICGATGFPVVSVDYRLAVEGVHYPVPEDDCVAAYRWVRQGGLGDIVDTTRIGIGGASAGACLAASTTVRERDAGETPWRLLLVYPILHAPLPELSAEHMATMATVAGSPLCQGPGSEMEVAEAYLGTPVDSAPRAFPGNTTDLAGLPPTFIENCEFDELRASGEQFARQLRTAEVPVQLRCAPGVPHGHLSVAGSPHAYRTMKHLSSFLLQSSEATPRVPSERLHDSVTPTRSEEQCTPPAGTLKVGGQS